MSSPVRPPRPPGRYGLSEGPSERFVHGAERPVLRSRQGSNSSASSSLNKPLPPSPSLKTPPLQTPSLHKKRSVSSISISVQEEIILSYFDRNSFSPESETKNVELKNEGLAPRVFQRPPAATDSQCLSSPDFGFATEGSNRRDYFTSSNAILPVCSVQAPKAQLNSQNQDILSPYWTNVGPNQSDNLEEQRKYNRSSKWAESYRNSLPVGPFTDFKSPSSIPQSSPHDFCVRNDVSTTPLISPSNSELNESIDSTDEHGSGLDFSISGSITSNLGNGLTTLRDLAKKAVARRRILKDEKERQEYIGTEDFEHRALAPPATSYRSSVSSRYSRTEEDNVDTYEPKTSAAFLKDLPNSIENVFPQTYDTTPLQRTVSASPAHVHSSVDMHTTQKRLLIRSEPGNQNKSSSPNALFWRGRPKTPAIPVSPYQMYGPKAWEMEEQETKKKEKEQRTNSKRGRSSSRASTDLERNQSPLSIASFGGTTSQLSPRSSDFSLSMKALPYRLKKSYGKATSPGNSPLIARSQNPSSVSLSIASATSEDTETMSWFGRRKARKEMEKAERRREEMKKNITLARQSTMDGSIITNIPGTPKSERALGNESNSRFKDHRSWI